MNVTKIARRLGTNSSRIKARLELLKLDPEIQALIAKGKLQKSLDVSQALLSIPDSEVRIKTAKRLAKKGISIRVIKNACERIRNDLAKPLPADYDKNNTSPAVHFGRQRSEAAMKTPIYNDLVAKGKFPPWELLAAAADQACKVCSLYDIATVEICKECPAVELITKVIEINSKQKDKEYGERQHRHPD